MPISTDPSPWRRLFADDSWPSAKRFDRLDVKRSGRLNSQGTDTEPRHPASSAPPCLLALLAPLQEVLDASADNPGPQLSRTFQPELVQALLRLDLPPWRISQILSDHNDWIYCRCIDASLKEMHSQGWGEPPVDFCVLTLGSGARHESLLGPDQDNAMILGDYPDDQHTAIDTWFQSLSQRFTEHLDRAGIALCHGHVMARWPLWRKRLSSWQKQMDLWTRQRQVKIVQFSNILLDFYPVYGNKTMADTLRQHTLSLMPNAGLFLDEMAALLKEVPVALDPFDHLSGDGRDAPHAQAINLKRQGLLPLQSALRLLSLVQGIADVDSRARIASLTTQQVMTPSLACALNDAINRIQSLLLHAQLNSILAGRPCDNWLDIRTLSESETLLLKYDLRKVRELTRLARHKVPGVS